MQGVGLLQLQRLIGFTLLVDQQRKIDAGFVAKCARIAEIAQSHGGKLRAFFFKLFLVFAQLRDMLAAENSTVVAQKHDHGRLVLPQRTELDFVPIHIRQHDMGQSGAIGRLHAKFPARTGMVAEFALSSEGLDPAQPGFGSSDPC